MKRSRLMRSSSFAFNRFQAATARIASAPMAHHPFLTSRYLPGHEATGTVIALGDGVAELAVGQRVLLKPNVACGDCHNCGASVPDGWRFCDSDCRDDYEREIAARRREGLHR